MKKFQSLGKSLSRDEMKSINAGKVAYPCYTYTWSGSNQSGSSSSCDYNVKDAMGNSLSPVCETACMSGCSSHGTSCTIC